MAGGGGEQDLNLVPYMDIMVNLIMFMLVVTAYINELNMAPVLAPPLSSDGGGGQSETKPYLTVAVSSAGLLVLCNVETIPDSQLPVTNGEYPFSELTGVLQKYKEDHPTLTDSLRVTAEGPVPYKHIISVMDAARYRTNATEQDKRDGKNSLFKDVQLGAVVQ
jgi:biopolymer transport protein TolR